MYVYAIYTLLCSWRSFVHVMLGVCMTLLKIVALFRLVE